MKTVEIPISSRVIFDIALKEEIKGLDEIVVTALGIKREKKALDYSTQTVKY